MTGKPGEEPLDSWSIVHVLGGISCGMLVRDPVLALGLIIGYEYLEGGLRRVRPAGASKGLFEDESWTNIRHDVLFGFLGWVFAQGLPFVDAWPFAWP